MGQQATRATRRERLCRQEFLLPTKARVGGDGGQGGVPDPRRVYIQKNIEIPKGPSPACQAQSQRRFIGHSLTTANAGNEWKVQRVTTRLELDGALKWTKPRVEHHTDVVRCFQSSEVVCATLLSALCSIILTVFSFLHTSHCACLDSVTISCTAVNLGHMPRLKKHHRCYRSFVLGEALRRVTPSDCGEIQRPRQCGDFDRRCAHEVDLIGGSNVSRVVRPPASSCFSSNRYFASFSADM